MSSSRNTRIVFAVLASMAAVLAAQARPANATNTTKAPAAMQASQADLSLAVEMLPAIANRSTNLGYNQCNGPNRLQASTPAGWLREIRSEGVFDDAARINSQYGFNPTDMSFTTWVLTRTKVVHLKYAVSGMDYRCPGNSHTMVPWEQTTRDKGSPVGMVLPKNLVSSDVRETPHKGFKAVELHFLVIYADDCGNEWVAMVTQLMYVRETIKVPTQPKAPQTCTINNSPGATCSGPTECSGINNCNKIWVSCSTLVNSAVVQQSRSFDTEYEVNNWATNNCTSPPIIQTCTSNCQSPPPVCTSNCLPVPPCSTSPQPKWCGVPGPQPPASVPGPNPSDGQPNANGTPPASGPPNPNGNPPTNNGGTQCPPGWTPDGNGGCK